MCTKSGALGLGGVPASTWQRGRSNTEGFRIWALEFKVYRSQGLEEHILFLMACRA